MSESKPTYYQLHRESVLAKAKARYEARHGEAARERRALRVVKEAIRAEILAMRLDTSRPRRGRPAKDPSKVTSGTVQYWMRKVHGADLNSDE